MSSFVPPTYVPPFAGPVRRKRTSILERAKGDGRTVQITPRRPSSLLSLFFSSNSSSSEKEEEPLSLPILLSLPLLFFLALRYVWEVEEEERERREDRQHSFKKEQGEFHVALFCQQLTNNCTF